MKNVTTVLALALAVFAAPAFATTHKEAPAMAASGAAMGGGDCAAKAAEKKLAGAAMNSFMKKCEKDNMGACDMQAKEKKLAGAAKTSFVKKCKADGPKA